MPSASRVTRDMYVIAGCQDQVFLDLGSNELDHIGFNMVATIISFLFLLISQILIYSFSFCRLPRSVVAFPCT